MSEFFAHRINKQSINQAFTNSAFVVLGFSIPPPLRVEEDLAIDRAHRVSAIQPRHYRRRTPAVVHANGCRAGVRASQHANRPARVLFAGFAEVLPATSLFSIAKRNSHRHRGSSTHILATSPGCTAGIRERTEYLSPLLPRFETTWASKLSTGNRPAIWQCRQSTELPR